MNLTEQPLVSIITVSYNSSAYIRDAIESVLAQRYENIEYIIADDCSTDNTWAIIQEYKDPRIKAYRNEKNLQEYSNRNKAIDHANGEYLIFVDGDDIIYPEAVNRFIEMITAFPEAGMAIQRSYYNNLLFPLLLNPVELLLNKFFGKYDLMTSSLASNFFKTDVIRSVGKFDTKLKASDEAIRVRIACSYPILFINGWLVWPRETPGQASSKINIVGTTLEAINFVQEFKANGVLPVSGEIAEKIDLRLKRTIAINILLMIKKMKVSEAFAAKRKSTYSWIDLFKFLNHKVSEDDFSQIYDASNPLKRDFNKNPNRRIEKNQEMNLTVSEKSS